MDAILVPPTGDATTATATVPTDLAAYAQVAVPVPLPAPLTYAVPAELAGAARPGMRVRVRLGRRRLVGVVTDLTDRAPEGIEVRPLEGVLDLEPVLPAELLDLASFVADYYLAPLGEVLAAMLPGDLPPWGDQRVWLTDGGAVAPARSELESAIVAVLREHGRMRVAELHRRVGDARFPAALESMRAQGRVALAAAAAGRSGRTRYTTAVQLAPGDVGDHLAGAGRSAAGRQVVEYLAVLGRPATQAEVEQAVGCGPGVVRRLVKLGVVQRFTQIERLSLDRHVLEEGGAPPRRLRPDQEAAIEVLTAAVASQSYAPFLLSGVTGSGKTEVYLRAAGASLEQGRSVILLVPEIALVPALAAAARGRFGGGLAVLHSALAPAERQQEWERVRRGEARIVLGPRSAIFAPVADLGLVVVDEEQDPAYKQESVPRYHGRDLALVRGQRAGATVLLVSATPSLESRHNAGRGKLTPLRLTERVGQGSLPEGIVVDLRQEPRTGRPGDLPFSQRLREETAAVLAAGDQAIFLRNRRGFAPLLLCRACGEDFRCDACGLPRTYHKRARRLLCHYCGSTLPAPTSCPACGEAVLEPIGAGTERVEETVRELFPGVAVDVLDRDATRRPGGAAAVLERFAQGRTRLLIGTQMVSKGHHFPGVALAAVLAADTYLGFPDFRAVERTYTLLTQLAGRAGRGDRPGRVVVQTYHPDHYAIRAALDHDDEAFTAEEMRFREIFHYPPFTRMVHLLVRDRIRERAEEAAAGLARQLVAHPLCRSVRLLGPAPAAFERLRGHWRYQLLLRATSGNLLRALLAEVVPARPGFDLTVDIDPYQLL